MALQSYKPYSRLVTVVSGLIIIIASLDASQVINLFPEYASQINTILMICGLLAPAISQELRVVRAEDLVKEDMSTDDEGDVKVHITFDGEDILEMVDEKSEDEEEISESEGA